MGVGVPGAAGVTEHPGIRQTSPLFAVPKLLHLKQESVLYTARLRIETSGPSTDEVTTACSMCSAVLILQVYKRCVS